jgi:hypothetical protein
MTFGEYRDGLRLFHDFHATGDAYFDTANRYFYRPKKSFHYLAISYDGNIRERYNSNTLDLRSKGLSSQPGFVWILPLFASLNSYRCQNIWEVRK